MAKFFMDTEFFEGTQEKTLFGFTVGHSKPTIDLISIGIVSEEDKEYYAISKDFNLKGAWNSYQIEQYSGDMRNKYPEGKKVYWLRENVLMPIVWELYQKYDGNALKKYGNYNNFKGFIGRKGTAYDLYVSLIKAYGKTNRQIAQEVKEFCTNDPLSIEKASFYNVEHEKASFYAYFADYDWVVFCWLFGKMINLPKGFPKYCKDLKQYSDAVEAKNASMRGSIKNLKDHPDYPKQINGHNAIADARWNKKFYEFLNNF